MKKLNLLICFALFFSSFSNCQRPKWIPLFDGKTLQGWKASENSTSFSVKDGMIVCDGPRSHLFYSGDIENAQFKNFELKAEIKTTPGANSGIYFHTEYQETGWPDKGYEVQVNNTHVAAKGHNDYTELKRSGSLYAVRNVYKQFVRDNEWFELRIVVNGRNVRIFLQEMLLVDYIEPDFPVRRENMDGRNLAGGTLALQCHDPDSKVFYKNIMVKPLSDKKSQRSPAAPIIDHRYAQIGTLQGKNFPIVDLHVHLKGGLTLEEALQHSRETGINYGIAINCGVGFPVNDDEGIEKFVLEMRNKPVFVGMQAEGREWVDTFSKHTISKFDYVFTDALTFRDDQGKRIRLWIKDEVNAR